MHGWRLLADARSDAFYRPFIMQWLDMDQPITIAMDNLKKQDFRFGRHLKASLREEPIRYIAQLIAENRPAQEMIISDWTLMNDILAIHYGYPRIEGTKLQKVKLRPDDPRGGGILGHAGLQSMLTWMGENWVIYRGSWPTACGQGQAAMGPFYCPGDEKVYIDLGFFDELQRRFGAPGDFAQAYVLAHEIGHHVQNLTGTERKLREAQRASPEHANALSVRMELQADCYAGVWANSTARRDLLERGDAEEALGAASAVGDDRIQEMSGSGVRPESFTHGSAEQRMEWFQRGFETGDANACDTFAS